MLVYVYVYDYDYLLLLLVIYFDYCVCLLLGLTKQRIEEHPTRRIILFFKKQKITQIPLSLSDGNDNFPLFVRILL